MATWYYYNESGVKVGPLGDREFRQLVQQGAIARETVIETESGQKAKAEKVKGLFPLSTHTLGAPPPVPAASQISFSCPSCHRNLKVKAEHAGRTLRCPSCQGSVAVPAAKSSKPPAAKPVAAPVVPASEWGDDLTRLLEESTQSDALKAKNEQVAKAKAKAPVRQPTKQRNSDGIGYFDVLFKKYADFDGRARRKEFWMFFLVNMILLFVWVFLGVALAIHLGPAAPADTEAPPPAAAFPEAPPPHMTMFPDMPPQTVTMFPGAPPPPPWAEAPPPHAATFPETSSSPSRVEVQPPPLILLFVGLLGLSFLLYGLLTIIPMLAVTARRFHDIGYTGWLLLLHFVPYVGTLIVLVILTRDSQPGRNQYGPNPKGY